jgi:hypothetical protein
LFFIHLESRRVGLAGLTKHPTVEWMIQMARNATDVPLSPKSRTVTRFLSLHRNSKNVFQQKNFRPSEERGRNPPEALRRLQS